MLLKLRTKDTTISESADQAHLRTLFEENGIIDVLQFIDDTEMGKSERHALTNMT